MVGSLTILWDNLYLDILPTIIARFKKKLGGGGGVLYLKY